MKTCIFCNATSEDVGLEGLGDDEAYCPFCNKTSLEYVRELFSRIEALIERLKQLDIRVKQLEKPSGYACNAAVDHFNMDAVLEMLSGRYCYVVADDEDFDGPLQTNYGVVVDGQEIDPDRIGYFELTYPTDDSERWIIHYYDSIDEAKRERDLRGGNLVDASAEE